MNAIIINNVNTLFPNKIEEAEERDYGELSNAVYVTYATAVGGILTAAIFFSFILMQGSRNLTDIWLAYWVSEVTSDNRYL